MLRLANSRTSRARAKQRHGGTGTGHAPARFRARTDRSATQPWWRQCTRNMHGPGRMSALSQSRSAILSVHRDPTLFSAGNTAAGSLKSSLTPTRSAASCDGSTHSQPMDAHTARQREHGDPACIGCSPFTTPGDLCTAGGGGGGGNLQRRTQRRTQRRRHWRSRQVCVHVCVCVMCVCNV